MGLSVLERGEKGQPLKCDKLPDSNHLFETAKRLNSVFQVQ
jgi:hypothetical protein